MKGQSLIVQFLLFFVIGLGLFAAISGIFRTQSDIIREDISTSNRELTASYLSSIAVSMATSCKGCNITASTVYLRNITAGKVTEMKLSGSGLKVTSLPDGGSFSTTMHNLHKSHILQGTTVTALPVVLSYNNTKNKQEFTLK